MYTGVKNGLFSPNKIGVINNPKQGILNGISNGIANEMLLKDSEITNGLIFFLDSSNTYSYPGSGASWYDLSGNGNTGTLVNTPIFNYYNKGGIVFDGTSNLVNCGTNISTTFSNLTLEIFIKSNKINTKQSLISTFQSNLGFGLEILSNNTLNFFIFNSSGSAVDVQTTSTINSGFYYHICGVFTSNLSVSIYINGILSVTKSTAFSSVSRSASSILMLARDSDAVQNIYYGGNIYIFRLYNRALSTNEVAQNYISSKYRFCM